MKPGQHGSGAVLNDAELEWDDYDLRPKEEVEEETTDALDYILTEGVFPLVCTIFVLSAEYHNCSLLVDYNSVKTRLQFFW